MRSAGCCVNDVADRDYDRHIKRPAARPVTSGLVSVREALTLGAALAAVAFALVLSTNPPTIWLSVAGLVITALYPFAKRGLSLPQAVLGVAFSFGIPMAFAAVLGGRDWALHSVPDAVPPHAWGLLLGNAFWVLAYDTEYAMVDREDDRRIGLKSSAILLGKYDVAGVMASQAVFLAMMAAIGRWQLLGVLYYAGLVVAAALVYHQYRLIRTRDREGCFKAFLNNNWVGFAIFLGLVADLHFRFRF
jgi:4-hydroxybenzoate polyprenyltransferase